MTAAITWIGSFLRIGSQRQKHIVHGHRGFQISFTSVQVDVDVAITVVMTAADMSRLQPTGDWVMGVGSNGKIPIKVGIMYDLPPDPEKFDPKKTNINPGFYELDVRARVSKDYLWVERDFGQIESLASFLKERREDEERLDPPISENLTVFVYKRT